MARTAYPSASSSSAHVTATRGSCARPAGSARGAPAARKPRPETPPAGSSPDAGAGAAGDGAPPAASQPGSPLAVDAQADRGRAVEFDAVIVPGGYAPDVMRRHPAMVGLVREAAQQGKVVAAICP